MSSVILNLDTFTNQIMSYHYQKKLPIVVCSTNAAIGIFIATFKGSKNIGPIAAFGKRHHRSSWKNKIK